MAFVRVKERFQVTLPSELRASAGLAVGDMLEARLGPRGEITLTPRSLIDRSIAEGLADVRAGRVRGPFASGQAMGKAVEAAIKRSSRRKRQS